MKNTLLICFITSILLHSCKNQDKSEIKMNVTFGTTSLGGTKNATFKIDPTDPVFKWTFVDYEIPDTLILNKQYKGVIKFAKPFRDSIKASKNDYRLLLICLEIENKTLSSDDLVKRYIDLPCDTLVGYSERFTDTIRTPFIVTPRNLGLNFIHGILSDEIVLDNYNTKPNDTIGKVRLIEEKQCFQFPVFVKASGSLDSKN